MTPKEKALDLVDKFMKYSWFSFLDGYEESSRKDSAIKCSLIAVNEILDVLFQHHEVDYWKDVKIELEKL